MQFFVWIFKKSYCFSFFPGVQFMIYRKSMLLEPFRCDQMEKGGQQWSL